MAINLIIDLRQPDGTKPPSGSKVSVRYDRLVRTTDGLTPYLMMADKEWTGDHDPSVIIPHLSDSPDVAHESQGFGIIVHVSWPHDYDRETWEGMVSISSSEAADGSTINLSDLPQARYVAPTDPVGYIPGPQGPAAPLPDFAWTGDQLTVTSDGIGKTGPHLMGPAGPSGVGNVQLDTDGVPYVASTAAMPLRGTGSPVGVVTPPAAGVHYTDTAGTLGAWEWISTGTTNTSWIVVRGDTGLRRITWPTTWGGELLVRRSGDQVAFNLNGFAALVNGTGSPDPLVTLPVGFRPWASINGPVRVGGSWNSYTNGTVTTDVTSSSKTYQQFGWQTREPWPTTLPGTPA